MKRGNLGDDTESLPISGSTQEVTMQALVPTRNGDATVTLAVVDDPLPNDDELVVAVEAFSINRGETFLLEAPRAGWRPGKDIAGTVIHAAKNGAGPRVGARVVAHPPARGWAERVAVSTDDVAEIPAELTAIDAAALPLAGLTAVRLLRRVGTLLGRRLLITGASGGVGHYLVELAANSGADVTAVSSTSERGARLLELGAATVLTDIDDAVGTFDVVVESVGGAAFTRALKLVLPEGLLVWSGQASRTPPTIDFFSFFDGPVQARIEHFDYTRSDRSTGDDLALLVGLVQSGRLHPEIGSARPWTQTADVIADLRARKIRGKAVLTLH
jgi:NADPH2:quinone reductase